MTDLPIAGPQISIPDAAAMKRREDAKRVASEFEAVFVGEMTKTMINTGPEDGLFQGGQAEQIYKGMLAEQLGKEIARMGGVGLAPKVMNEIIKMQGDQ